MINAFQVKVSNLNNLSWKNIPLKSNYNTLKIQHQAVTLATGVSLDIPRIFLNAKDVSINNGSILVLGNTHKVNNIFEESSKQFDSKKLLSKSSIRIYKDKPKTISNSYIIKKGIIIPQESIPEENTQDSFIISTKDGVFSLTNNNNIKNTEVFNFNFKDDYVTVSNNNNLFITDRTSFIQLLPKSNTSSQKFNYILNDISIILFRYKSNFTQVLDFSFNNGSVVFVPVSSINDISKNSILYIDQLIDLPKNFNSIKNSFIAKYDTNPLSASNTLELDSYTKQLNYNQNYLINIPINSYTGTDQTHIAYINSLKNYQTANYNYSLTNNITTKRNYTSLFTGTNQKFGYNNIYLNYTSNTLEKVLLKDKETTFHYPATITTNGIPISASGLIQEGAISGKNPYTADRLMLSRKDYRELNIPLLSATIADNTWQYAWLSAGDGGESQWMDRFYRGAKFDLTEQEYLSYTINDPLVVDEPSTIMLLPNRVYKYFHQGQNNIKKYIENLTTIDTDNSTKILEIVDWSTNILNDTSVYENNGIISLNSEPLSSEYFYLDGKSYALFPSTSSMSEDKQLYAGFWLKVSDWSEIEGSQILGNYSDGGFGLFNKQSIPTTFITLYDNNHNYIYNINSSFKVVNEQSLITTYAGNTAPVFIVRTAEQNYWLINSGNLTAGKYDLNNNLLIEVTNLSPLKYISQVEIDDVERIYVIDNRTKKFIIFDSYTGVIMRDADFMYKRLELVSKYNGPLTSRIIDIGTSTVRTNDRLSQATMLGIDGDCSVSDNSNNIWYSVGVNLYKNSSLYANIGHINYITCDSNNNIWILHDRNKISKIDTANNIIAFTKIFSSTKIDTSVQSQVRFINFISIKENNKEIDYTIIVDSEEKTCYIIDTHGILHSKINLLIVPSVFLSKHNFIRNNINFTCYGDFTGYQFQRKFNNNSELVWKTKLSGETDTKVVHLPFDTTRLDKGWHYFSFAFNHSKGYVAAYTDGVEVNKYQFTPFKYRIKASYKPLCVGAITTDQGILNDTIGLNDKHKIIAYFANLHIYKYAFDIRDIDLLYKSTYIDLYKDLTWNIEIGNRNYIEQIERFFMHKMPGSKSKFFNIKVKNFPATEKQKKLIEQAITDAIVRIVPADTKLHLIKWD